MVEQINDFVTGARAINERGQSYLKCSGRAVFVERLYDFLLREHIARPCQEDAHTLNDLRSEARLLLIFDTNVKRWWKPKNRDPNKPLRYL